MDGMLSYSKTAMERAMKVQEVISRAKAKKITGWQAADRDELWKRRWMEKSKNDFPTQLGNPANPRDSHFPTAPATAGD